MQDLAGKSFELIENSDGHASGSTMMRFEAASNPCKATYSGPNINFGQAIVQGNEMLYQALESDGKLTAGRATVSILEFEDQPLEMRLQWAWLTGDRSSGVSIWRQVENLPT